MSDTLTAVGSYETIEEKKSGWYDVHVKIVGKQYPLRLSTKSSNMLDKVRDTKGAVSTFIYVERESTKENPNTGKPYVNRFLEDVQVGATAEAQAASGNSDRMTKEEWNAKDRRDYRSRSWAQTISAFAHTVTVEEKPLDVFARLKPFQRKLYEDIVGDLEPAPQPQPQPQQEQMPAADEPPYDDDDIPF